MKENKILGALMIPEKKIYRNPNINITKPHYVCFSKETIEQLREKFHSNKFEKNVNLNHKGKNISTITLTKSFIINKNNITNLPNEFRELPIGTWMIEYLVKDEKIWKMIINKELNGFSIEGIFDYPKFKEK